MRPRTSRLARPCLTLALAFASSSGCDKPEPPTRSPIESAAEAQRRLRVTGFVRALERERYMVAYADADQSRGASDPLVTIVAYVDAASPDPTVDEQLERQLAAHPDDLRLVVVQHPSKHAAMAAQAERLDVQRRPTLFVNGVALVGPETADELPRVVDAELGTARTLLALGARRDEIYPELMRRAVDERSEPPGPPEPVEIPWEPEFAVAALASEVRGGGVLVEDVVRGDGAELAEGQIVEFEFAGYSSLTGKQVMGSREEPAEMVLNEAMRRRDRLAAAMADAVLGMRVGGKRRVMVPAEIVDAERPKGRPEVGDLWMAIEIVGVREAPELEPVATFAGSPIASKRDADGLEIHDYRKGKGPKAKAGMTVTTHYIGQLADGTEFDSSHGRADALTVELGDSPGVIPGFARGLEGARPGMLRKLVIPPELAYKDRDQGKIPANATLIFYLQIMDVQPTEAKPE